MRAKSFAYICLGILALALAYHLGASTATAQAPGNPVVGIASSGEVFTVVTANGNAYQWAGGQPGWSPIPSVFGGPTPAKQESMGQLKVRYR